MSSTNRAALVIALLVFLALRWNSFTIPFERDEGEYAYSASLLSDGGLPYRDAYLQKPPLIVYTYFLGQVIGGESVIPPRILAHLSLSLSLALIFFILSRNRGTWAGLAGMGFMMGMLSSKILTPFAANTEVFLITPLLLLVLISLRYGETPSAWPWFLAGIAATLSAFFKPIAIVVAAFIFVVWGIETWKSDRNIPALFARLGAAGAGGLLCAMTLLLPFLIADLGRSFTECVILYNLAYAQVNTFGVEPFLDYSGTLLRDWWPAIGCAIAVFILRPARWWYFTSLLLVALLSIHRSTLGHYYILVVPFVALLSATALHEAFERLSFLRLAARSVARSASLALAILLMLWPQRQQLFASPDELSDRFYSRGNPFPEAQTVGELLRRASHEGDRVFIAGSEPEILYYAKRRSASRFVIMYPLMLNTPFALRYQQEAIDALAQESPEYVVLVTARFSWLEQVETPGVFKDFLVRKLREEYIVRGGTIRETGEWQPVVDPGLLNKFSLVVYERVAR